MVRYGAGVGRWPVARLVTSFEVTPTDLTCCDDECCGWIGADWATWIVTLDAATVLRQKRGEKWWIID